MTELPDKPRDYYDNVRDEMFKYIPHGVKRTLEFGCGTGEFSRAIKNMFGSETWAVEIDEKSAKTASGKLDNVIHSDAHEAIDKLPNDYFDCIVFLDVLEHLVEPYSLLSSIKNKLAENGLIVASIPNVRYYRTLIDYCLFGNWDYEDCGILDNTHLRFFTRKSIMKMFDQLDFEILKLEGLQPALGLKFKILNFLSLNLLSDTRYLQYAVTARPRRRSKINNTKNGNSQEDVE